MSTEARERPAGLHIARQYHTLWITIDRPQVANALREEDRIELAQTIEEAGGDPSVRSVVIAAAGRHFCSGADLSASLGGAERAVGDVARGLKLGPQRCVAAILDCEKPVIAEVHGAAAGIWAHIAFACDFIVAAEDARFLEAFVHRGLVPDGGGAYLLPRLVGLAAAKRLLLLGEIDARQAEMLGLLTDLVAPDALRSAVEQLTQRLDNLPTRALGFCKRMLNRSLDSNREQAFAEEALAVELNVATDDAREGLRAFAERREPNFAGR